jgi:hypothetical protein
VVMPGSRRPRGSRRGVWLLVLVIFFFFFLHFIYSPQILKFCVKIMFFFYLFIYFIF